MILRLTVITFAQAGLVIICPRTERVTCEGCEEQVGQRDVKKRVGWRNVEEDRIERWRRR